VITTSVNQNGGNVFNVFQGVVNGNQVTWFGVPILQPGTTGITRTFRFTNVRANATILSGGQAANGTPVNAFIAVSQGAQLPITTTFPAVGFVQAGLTTDTKPNSPSSTGTILNQCQAQTRANVATLTFVEGFGTAFKTRLAANFGTGSGQGNINVNAQNVPGFPYNSESGLVVPTTNFTAEAGLADFGTRLKATFANVPANVRLFVSVANVLNAVTPAPVPGSAISGGGFVGGSAAGIGSNNPATYAQLVAGENAVDSQSFVQGSNTFTPLPVIAASDNAPGVAIGGVSNTVGVAEVILTGGAGTAVWEIVNTNSAAPETIKFEVYATFTGGSPTAGTGTVTLSFAPTPGVAPQFSAGDAAKPSGGPIPRFSTGTLGSPNLLQVSVCRTILLYPFVTNQAGFDTGLAIANTSQDPFGTTTQQGTCDLNWFSGVASPAKITTAVILPGTVYTNLASVAVPNFQGYMIAVCQFQFAHGFAFISDLGAQKLAMGYLALVIPDPGPGTPGRPASPLSAAGGGSGEANAH